MPSVFAAKVQRVSPVVDAETGTVRVTLEVKPEGKLRPGMFASVYLETERRENSLVIPRRALVLDSLGDTVYVAGEGVAERRDVVLGFREGDYVEVQSGLAEAEPIVVIGQDGLADGTPIQVASGEAAPSEGSAGGTPGTIPAAGDRRRLTDGPPMAGELTPERIESIRERMRERGMSEEKIDARVEQMKKRLGESGSDA